MILNRLRSQWTVTLQCSLPMLTACLLLMVSTAETQDEIGPVEVGMAKSNQSIISLTPRVMPSPRSAPQTPKIATVGFPLAGCTNAASITAIGTVSTSQSTTTSVEVNGVAATSQNNFATWRATSVPLEFGSNPLAVAVQDTTGYQDLLAAGVTVTRNSILFRSPRAIALDSANNRVLVTETGRSTTAIVAVDLSSGNRTVISDANTGTGQDLTAPYGITLDSANNRVLVADEGEGIYSVDLSSGNRTIVSGNAHGSGLVGSGPGMAEASGIALDSANNRLVVYDRELARLLAVDLSSGNRTTIADENTGAGEDSDWFACADCAGVGIALDSANNRVLLADEGAELVLAIDLSTGNKTVISSDDTGHGTNFDDPYGIALDSANNRAIVADEGAETIVAVDLSTGNRTMLSGVGTGSGPKFEKPRKLVVDSANNRVLVVDSSLDTVVAVDLSTGNRTIISDYSCNYGPVFETPLGLVLDSANNRVLVADSAQDAVMSAHLTSGERTFFSRGPVSCAKNGTSCQSGSGIDFDYADGIVLDSANNRLLVADSDLEAIVAVDLSTRNRTIFSDSNTGTGELMGWPTALVMDSANNRVLVADDKPVDGVVMAVDLATGNRTKLAASNLLNDIDGITFDSDNNNAVLTNSSNGQVLLADLSTGNVTILSDSSNGSGATLDRPEGITMDSANNRVLVADCNTSSIISVDLSTGNRTTISSSTVGSGHLFTCPYDIELDIANDRVLATDRSLDAVVAVELVSGDRIVISK